VIKQKAEPCFFVPKSTPVFFILNSMADSYEQAV